MNEAVTKLTLKDFASDQEVRWCPGCGDYAILKTIQRLMPELDSPRENQVFISGIGCSSRFPYYMNTYGFHTIHGRAPAVATGVKLANPELDVWVITGDGDGFSIGGNHMIHALRRNVDLQILLFNNEIYGLTKGQYSPTSQRGTKSPSSPKGSIDSPLSPCEVALGSGATFIARSIDTEAKHLSAVTRRAYDHNGASFVEILQNCPIYADGIFDSVKDKKTAADFKLILEHGQPCVFGKEAEKGIHLNRDTLALEVVSSDDADKPLLIHDENNKILANMLATMSNPDFPVAVGVIYQESKASFIEDTQAVLKEARNGTASLQELLLSGHTWEVSS
ncbi:MAG: 2-oxoacid:ferredoxin oxidoreductase subunit beta [Gammaproteobacteria bacterium]|jgi:2-oxoglutarate ferredoxin oxidoreductase subunit beta|nr:2-oxoacid:ferredoxin oxidoreductase subunit beta [Gammaproteobacteria bacterium]MBT3859052.1 2-oxoacid:ferredoxin oxidoreductase subunit beta [Gammaproteobacteria bacterium]MBT3987837.1 2-oxoacid:ferredoxin oxidoreductase subunit beta [Gammaproteobacteria bacterium]MBT4257205.1 2-oxoacid:ferredoxin oxidoreductase subunit beta [Gammaproteobacteria bacterium]MBT4581516.1 2-oxoacid:ferredoxin oxidoreductase subunit beta [Gammaproteobacteria bacterium]